MDNYELGQDVVDLADFQPRRVRLQATRTEIPVKAATPADEELARLSRERALQTQISQQTESVRQPTDLISKTISIVCLIKDLKSALAICLWHQLHAHSHRSKQPI